ncbi:PepSY-associated TM helix domain-containing protein [Oceanobacillus iheyensis]|uniref:PepSY-associated TM helix domain-containing protein n=1 Tax=Oceanobacillus iheyensis TaxID=182710 RepID=UPI00363FF7DE
MILSITGSIYLFKPQIEQFLYEDYYDVVDQGEKLPPSALVDEVKENYPEAGVTKFRPGEDATRSAEVKITQDGETHTIFVDPYNAEIIGQLNDQHRIIDRVEEFHGELMLDTYGDLIVELVACWTLALVLTGIYLWRPKKMRVFGVFLPRLKARKRTFIRDLHAVPGVWLSIAIVFLVFTGLLWTGNWGTKFQNLTTNSGFGYPPSIWVGSAPSSEVQTKDIADVPWAAETLEVPTSNQNGYLPVSVDEVVNIADQQEIYPTYEVIYPQTDDGVYTISVFPPKARDEATMHIDQYTGAILADYRYDNYQPLGKLMAWGITVHKGLEYGLINQIIGLIVCLGIIGLVIGGTVLW